MSERRKVLDGIKKSFDDFIEKYNGQYLWLVMYPDNKTRDERILFDYKGDLNRLMATLDSVLQKQRVKKAKQIELEKSLRRK